MGGSPPQGGVAARGDRRAEASRQEEHPGPGGERGRDPAQRAGRDGGRGGGGGPPRRTEGRPHPGQPKPDQTPILFNTCFEQNHCFVRLGRRTGRSRRAAPSEAGRGTGAGAATARRRGEAASRRAQEADREAASGGSLRAFQEGHGSAPSSLGIVLIHTRHNVGRRFARIRPKSHRRNMGKKGVDKTALRVVQCLLPDKTKYPINTKRLSRKTVVVRWIITRDTKKRKC